MTSAHEPNPVSQPGGESVQLPSPTLWPPLLALGLALAAIGLVTNYIVAVVGGVLALAGCVGWFVQVLPRERHEIVPVLAKPAIIAASPRKVARIAATAEARPHRARLPLEIYPISAGIKGGLAGAAAMALLAALYGVASHHSIWYPINLLGAVVYAQTQVSTAEMEAFHLPLLLVATVLHLTTSILVGLLYGALLPMLPRRPIVLGGLFAPLVWTGLLYNVLDIVDPLLNQRIDWGWFLASQIGFGLVAGAVVVRQMRVPTWQFPLAVRAGVETPGMMGEEHDT
ncbi:MAG TPA: hypothetical protein VMD77_15960 [Candidatus Baltobacteraceae bacterium]|jgi:hypothetical protein|nr:hypothetical protein [Candidatus Baltobacteraceae bacterium]